MATSWPTSHWVEAHRERIGLALQVFPLETRSEPARHLLAAGQLAESLGFDACFFGDHPAWGLDCWLHMAALAVTTSRIRLGPNVACAGYRHPVLLARLAADLDNLSGGRLILGLGAGWDANEYANLGLPFPSVAARQAQLEETIQVLRGVWGEQPWSFAGRYVQTTAAQVRPGPLQRPAPPLMIAGGGERVTLRQVAQYADACQLAAFGMVSGAATAEGVRQKLAVLRQHCDATGRPYETVLRTHFTGWLILAEDAGALAAKVRAAVPEGLERRFNGPWSGFAIAATPAEAVAMYQELAAAGIQYFIIEILDAADTETIRILAERVMPALRR